MSAIPPNFCTEKHLGHERVWVQVIRSVKGKDLYANFGCDAGSAQFLWNLLRKKKDLVGLQTYDRNTRIIQEWRK